MPQSPENASKIPTRSQIINRKGNLQRIMRTIKRMAISLSGLLSGAELLYWTGQKLSHTTDKVPQMETLLKELFHPQSVPGALRILKTIIITLPQNWVSFVNSEVFNLGLIKGTDHANKLLDNFVNFASNDATIGAGVLLGGLVGLTLYRMRKQRKTN